jgi:hypothetical protein
MKMEPCKCKLCMEKIASLRVTDSHARAEFIQMLKDGRVQHIGTDAQGHPYYKDVR